MRLLFSSNKGQEIKQKKKILNLVLEFSISEIPSKFKYHDVTFLSQYLCRTSECQIWNKSVEEKC